MVCGLVAITQASWGLIVPVLPIYARQFNASAFELGLVVSAFSIARLVVNIPAGLIADRVNRRVMILVAAVGVAAILALTATVQSLAMLFVMRALLGLCGGVVITVGQALLAELTEGKNRGQAMATLQAFQLAGGSLGPALGGITASFWGPPGSYLVAGGICLVMTIIAIVRLPHQPAQGTRVRGKASGNPLVLFRDPSYVASCLVGFTVFFVRFGGQQTLVPLIAYTWADVSTRTFGISLSALTVLNLLQVRFVGRMSDKSRKVPIVASLLVTGVGYVVFAYSHDWVIFFVALAIVGLANGFSGSTPAAYCADVVSARLRGSGIGVYRTFGDLGGLIGPIFLGAMVDWRGNSLAAWGVAIIVTLAACAFAAVAKETVGSRASWKAVHDDIVEDTGPEKAGVDELRVEAARKAGDDQSGTAQKLAAR